MPKKSLDKRTKVFVNLITGYIVLLVLSFFSMSFCSFKEDTFPNLCSQVNSGLLGLWVTLILVSILVVLLKLIKKKK